MPDAVREQFQDKAICRHGMWLYPKDVAIQIVEFCRQNEIRLDGIEGLWMYYDGSIQPTQENSQWFTQETVHNAVEFLSGTDEECVFELFYEGY